MIVIKHRTCRDIILLRLHEADLEGMLLDEAYLAQAEMAGQHCRGASFQKANLTAADLSRADLRETDFRGAKLRRSNLRHADLRGASLAEADLCGANLQRADLRGADLSQAVLFDADLTWVQYDDATLWPAGGAFIPHPSVPVATWLLVSGGWRDSRAGLSEWVSTTQPRVSRAWQGFAARVAGPAVAGAALAAAALAAVLSSQVTLPRAAPEVAALRPKPAVQVVPQPTPPPIGRVAAAPRSKRRAPAALAKAGESRRVQMRPRGTSALRRQHERLAVAPRRRSRRIALHHARPRPSTSHRRLSPAAQAQPVTVVAQASPQPQRSASPDRRDSTVQLAGNSSLPRRSAARLAVYEGPAQPPRPARRTVSEAPVVTPTRAATAVTPVSPPPDVTAPPVSRRPRERKKPRGVRYAFGNSGFHYGSGYDIYRMNIPSGGAEGR